MLPKALRLTFSRDFSQVYKRGKRFTTRNLQFFLLPAPNLVNQNVSRFGFVVSKKHAAKIVRRNRIKRILRSLVSKQKSMIPPGFYCVVVAKTGIDALTGAELRREFEDLLGKVKNEPRQ